MSDTTDTTATAADPAALDELRQRVASLTPAAPIGRDNDPMGTGGGFPAGTPGNLGDEQLEPSEGDELRADIDDELGKARAFVAELEAARAHVDELHPPAPVPEQLAEVAPGGTIAAGDPYGANGHVGGEPAEPAAMVEGANVGLDQRPHTIDPNVHAGGEPSEPAELVSAGAE